MRALVPSVFADSGCAETKDEAIDDVGGCLIVVGGVSTSEE